MNETRKTKRAEKRTQLPKGTTEETKRKHKNKKTNGEKEECVNVGMEEIKENKRRGNYKKKVRGKNVKKNESERRKDKKKKHEKRTENTEKWKENKTRTRTRKKQRRKI